MCRCVLWGDRNDGQVQASTKRLSDVPTADAFFANRVITCASFTRFQGEPLEAHDIGKVTRRPAVAALSHIGHGAFFASEPDER